MAKIEAIAQAAAKEKRRTIWCKRWDRVKAFLAAFTYRIAATVFVANIFFFIAIYCACPENLTAEGRAVWYVSAQNQLIYGLGATGIGAAVFAALCNRQQKLRRSICVAGAFILVFANLFYPVFNQARCYLVEANYHNTWKELKDRQEAIAERIYTKTGKKPHMEAGTSHDWH